ncbi:AbrB/MazE/SpoVT family DNA-binding domain-containing protein [Methanolobus sp. WCC5]
MTVSIQEFKGQYRITIPNDIIKLEGIKKGDKFNFVKVQGYLALEPVR